MDPNPRHHSLSQARIERLLLRALAEPSAEPALRRTIAEKLSSHRFAHFDHQILFRAIQAPGPPGSLSEAALVQFATRLGFPDIDVSLFSEPLPPEALLRDLLSRLDSPPAAPPKPSL